MHKRRYECSYDKSCVCNTENQGNTSDEQPKSSTFSDTTQQAD